MKKVLIKVLKGFLTILLIAALAAATGAFWYYFIRETPERILGFAIKAARQRDAATFQGYFAPLSVRALEESWSGETYGLSGSWGQMMEGLLEPTGGPPEVLDETYSADEQEARVVIRLEGRKRFVYFTKVSKGPKVFGVIPRGSDWRIDVLNGINASINEEARKEKARKAKPKKKKFAREPRMRGWWKPEEEKKEKPVEIEEEPDADKALKGPEPPDPSAGQ